MGTCFKFDLRQVRDAVATILSGDFSRAIPIVSSAFTVRDFELINGDEYVQFLIAESEVKDRFPSLLRELKKIGLVATANRSEYFRTPMPTLRSARQSLGKGVVLSVHRLSRQKPKGGFRRVLPLALFLITVTVVFVDGILRSDSAFAKMGIEDPVVLAVVYTMSLMGILGIHELGHMIAAKEYGIRISWPYFVPFYPGQAFPPTLGAMIRLRSNMPSRNAMFDVGISGPIAGLIVTLIVAIYGSSISVLISVDEAQKLLDELQLPVYNSSILMMAAMQLTGTLSDNQVLVMSPVMFAAWMGFLLTFLNLVPASQLDGGHIARAALGSRGHRIITFAGIGLLFALFYPVMAVLVLFMALRAPEAKPLDDVTSISRGRKILFIVALGLAALCAPLPFAQVLGP
jgi:Zn-dependent protease